MTPLLYICRETHRYRHIYLYKHVVYIYVYVGSVYIEVGKALGVELILPWLSIQRTNTLNDRLWKEAGLFKKSVHLSSL